MSIFCISTISLILYKLAFCMISYSVVGTLFDQVTYPEKVKKAERTEDIIERVRDALTKMGLIEVELQIALKIFLFCCSIISCIEYSNNFPHPHIHLGCGTTKKGVGYI